jgi:hypothetical protein
METGAKASRRNPNFTIPREALAEFCRKWQIMEFSLYGGDSVCVRMIFG